MAGFEEIDFFTDASLLEDPYPYFEYLRVEVPGTGAAAPRRGGGLGLGRGDATCTATPTTFSSCNSVIGPFAEFPVPLEGDDVERRSSTATATSSR